jgi:hypothetical protein
MTERPDLDPHGLALENSRKLAEWKQQKKAEAEHQEREQKRAGLEEYLRGRARDWRDHVGEEPTPEEWRDWRREYMDARAGEQDLERELRLAESEKEHYDC